MQLTELKEQASKLAKEHSELVNEVVNYVKMYKANHITINCFNTYKKRYLWRFNYRKVKYFDKQIKKLLNEQNALDHAIVYCSDKAELLMEEYLHTSKEYSERICQ